MKRIPLLLIWVLTAFLSVVFAREERVAILGDSIPYAGGWPTLVTEGLHQSKQYADWLLVPWDASPEQEEELAKRLRISIRCIPCGEMGQGDSEPCILTGKPTTQRVLWARSY